MTIETTRLTLRRLRPDDLEPLAAILLHPRVLPWLGPPGATIVDVARAIDRYEAHWEVHGFGRFAVCDRLSGALVGRVGVMHEEAWEASVCKAEIGWAIDPGRWGQGLATEAATAALADVFGRVGLGEVISFALPTNAASIRVMEKLGLRQQGMAEWAGAQHVWYSVSGRGA